jgi:hypothetical protein
MKEIIVIKGIWKGTKGLVIESGAMHLIMDKEGLLRQVAENAIAYTGN